MQPEGERVCFAGSAPDTLAPMKLLYTACLLLLPISTLLAQKAADIFNQSHFTHMPPPKYPAEADEHHWTGKGVFLLRFQPDGKVTSVTVLQSTGHEALDKEASRTLAHWRCQPGAYSEVKVPIAFDAPAGPHFPVPLIDVAAALRKRTLLYAYEPRYPYEARRNHWNGSGIFQINFKPDGKVASVVVIRSAGHWVFDEEARTALVHWRAKPGAFTSIYVAVTFGR